MLDVVLIAKDKVLFEGQAKHVILPGEQGFFEICPFHKPLVSRLLPGPLFVDNLIFRISHGAIKVEHNHVTGLVALEDSK